jgi:hypothetical protein
LALLVWTAGKTPEKQKDRIPLEDFQHSLGSLERPCGLITMSGPREIQHICFNLGVQVGNFGKLSGLIPFPRFM